MHRLFLGLAFTLASCRTDNSIKIFNAEPTAEITSHSDGDEVLEGAVVVFRGGVGDIDHTAGDLTTTWFLDDTIMCESAAPDVDGITTCSFTMPAEANTVALEVRDPENAAGADQVSLTVVPTASPEAKIASPSADESYTSDRLITFEGVVSDAEDDAIDLVVSWSSTLDGELKVDAIPNAAGLVLGYGYLSEGEHAIELNVSDTSGKSGTASVIVQVGPADKGPDCDEDGDGFDSDSVDCGGTDCDDGDPTIHPDAVEICNGFDDNCDTIVDDVGPTDLVAGSLTDGTPLRYQYSPLTEGDGYLYANWPADDAADSYELAVGTTPGDDNILSWTDVGNGTTTTLSGLSLDGAWTGTEYSLAIRAVNGTFACEPSATSNVVQIAEAEVWTGDTADLRDNDSYGGASVDWPESGIDSIYGAHYFERVEIDATTTIWVQGWGAVDDVSEGIDSADIAVTDPADGWVALYANDITIAGMITASGRGYGGGGGGGAGVAGGYQGSGGSSGLGGDGGPGSGGGGGGGSPGGAGGVANTVGGDGNLYGGGSGGTACDGSNGRDGGDGAVGTIGGTGGTASSGVVGPAGTGEFDAGGGEGVTGCDNWSGGGGGGYGAGGGGGSQWSSETAEASGGGAGGAGGSGSAWSVSGGTGAGPYGGTGGTGGSSTGDVGGLGGYLASASNGDTSTDRSLELGSGGGGGSGGYQETGGGGGSAGGGAIHLYAFDTLTIDSTAYLLANGAGGGGGARDDGGYSTSGAGGVGAGGGIRLEAQNLALNIDVPYISARGGDGNTTNGGTIKLFYDLFSGTVPDAAAAGRVFDAEAGSWSVP